MPPYKNRPLLDPKTEVWHYTTTAAVLEILRERRLRLTRVDQWPDPFEGSVPKQQMDDQVPIFSSAYDTSMMMPHFYSGMPPHRRYRRRDPWEVMTKRRKAMVRAAHAICWRWGDESEAMWRLYCRDASPGQGLALRTTLGQLEASVERHDLYVSPIRYRHYHEGPSFDNEMDSFMHKRKGFEHEQEVRFIFFNTEHYQLENGALSAEEEMPPPAALPQYKFLDWSLQDAIERIVVSPYAAENYEAHARNEITNLNPIVGATIELSVLSARRYAPNF